jgi:hypothetical protein
MRRDITGKIAIRDCDGLRTRQFLPGGLLINEMEILRDCRVGHSSKQPGMRK